MRGLRGFQATVDRVQITPMYRECALEVERAYCARSNCFPTNRR